MTSHPHRGRGLTLAFGTAAISGVAVFVNAYGVRVLPDATVYTTAKNLVAAVLLALVAAAVATVGRTTGRQVRQAVMRRWYGLLAVAVVGGSVPFVLFFEGLAHASSGQAAFVHKTLVIWVALLAIPLLGERIRLPHYVAIGLLLAGQLVLGGGLAGFRFGIGEALLLAATLLWAVEVVVVKKLLADVPAQLLTVARMGLGVLLLLGWVAVTGRWSILTGLSATGWGWALLTGALLAGYVATWYQALAFAPAVGVTAVLVVAAIVTNLLEISVNGTGLSPTLTIGMILLAGGAALVVVARPRLSRLVEA